MTITDAATQVLFGQTLTEKLTVADIALPDTQRAPAICTPQAPARPAELALSESGVRAQFPGVNTLDQEASRGELLHFLANHELLASELMALVLLKFPDAPAAYRRGVYEAMREEQMHTLMYMRRMRETGHEFGQLPLNSYFWRLVSPMRSPMEFVTQLNLTFEQANLDFSHHYAQLFRQVGDTSTANVLEKIYQDEIGHVGHGIHWLREWKADPQRSDWETYISGLELPFSPAKAKGMAPYNPDGRRAAGLDEDFITRLSVTAQSRGRPPVLHWFNASAESAALAQTRGETYTPSSAERRIEQDLELLMLAACSRDDLLLLRQLPTTAHLQRLQEAGLTLPELALQSDADLTQRKLGGLKPWAWSPDASATLAPYQHQLAPSVPHQWQPAAAPETFSKHLGLQLQDALQLPVDTQLYTELSALEAALQSADTPLRLKLPYACSGRGHYRYDPQRGLTAGIHQALQRGITQHGSILCEPERDVVADFSVHYDLQAGRPARLRGYVIMQNTPSGQFLSATAAQKWTSHLPDGVPAYLFSQTNFTDLYNQHLPAALASLLPSFTGPLGVDAMVARQPDSTLQLIPIVEVNARHTMGRLALNLQRQLNRPQGTLTILPTSTPAPAHALPLNDPAQATTLQAYFV